MSIAWRLRIVYIVTVVLAGTAGMAIVMAPERVYTFYQLEVEKPLFMGICGTIWTSYAICAALALHSPLRFSPIVFLQCMYKAMWLIFYVGSHLVSRDFPPHMLEHALSFSIVLALDLWAMPWTYLFQNGEADTLDA